MIHLIETKEQLTQIVDVAITYDTVAIDTEFLWETTYFPILGLIQLGLPDGNSYLIDGVKIEDLTPLGKLMEDHSTTKVLHDAVQDLTIIRQYTDTFPNNIFDTRKAAGFIGLPCTISLAKLLKELLNITLPKTETRTNWIRRPLSDNQKKYAADDVLYLGKVKDIIESKISGTPVSNWLKEEMLDYDRNIHYQEKTARNQYIKVKGAKKLPPKKLALLRELAAWREIEAFEANRPRKRVMSDSQLMTLVHQAPLTDEALKYTQGFPYKKMHDKTEDILRAINKGFNLERSKYPQKIEEDSPEFLYTRVDETFTFIEKECKSHEIDPGLIGSKVDIKKYYCSGNRPKMADHRILTGWRSELLSKLNDI
ncbi:MAG: HRDC domain-containing protein [Fibrobacterales bacterium]